jgi:hypothetical protein
MRGYFHLQGMLENIIIAFFLVELRFELRASCPLEPHLQSILL